MSWKLDGLSSLMGECFERFCALESEDIKIQSQGTSQMASPDFYAVVCEALHVKNGGTKRLPLCGHRARVKSRSHGTAQLWKWCFSCLFFFFLLHILPFKLKGVIYIISPFPFILLAPPMCPPLYVLSKIWAPFL